jgi:hypothetical protein
MHFSKLYLAALVALVTTTAARPAGCDPRTLDKIFLGQLPKSACCSYGECVGDVNVKGGHLVR